MSLRIALNQTSALGQKTGVGYYTAQLLHALRSSPEIGQIDAFPSSWIQNLPRLWNRVNNADQGQHAPITPARRSLLGRVKTRGVHLVKSACRRVYSGLLQFHLNRYLSSGHYDLYHEPNYLAFPADIPTVVTVHDLSVILHPKWHPADRVRDFESRFTRSVTQATHFCTDTECIRQEMIQHLGLPASKITRTYMGVRDNMQPVPAEQLPAKLEQMGLPTRYLLYLGTLEPRKNLLTLLKAYCSMPANVRDRWPLVMVGSWGWNVEAIAEYYQNEARHRGVIHLGYVADEHLAALYSAARALVFPSHYEGFGLPPLEMMACGGAVLTSTDGALVEVTGKHADHIPANDLDGWRSAMLRVVSDDDWWTHLKQGVREHAQQFTWDRCARDTLAVYRKATGQRPEQLTKAA